MVSRMRHVRLERDLTVFLLSAAATNPKMSMSRISNLERGLAQPTSAERKELANLLGVSEEWLWATRDATATTAEEYAAMEKALVVDYSPPANRLAPR